MSDELKRIVLALRSIESRSSSHLHPGDWKKLEDALSDRIISYRRGYDEGFAQGIERAAKFISKEIESLVESNAYVESATNATVFTNEHAEALVNALDEILESVHALSPSATPKEQG